ncbi:MAG: hypoxanthine phosphoribosyltransferase [Clostridiales bacterium]|nr:hypoxanthine phosphoribosyltransferase [Clostridiales bacterium]
MHQDVEKILLTEAQIRERVSEAARWLDARMEGKFPLVVSVLKGSVMFFCDLVRAMKTSVQMDFMTISSYGSGSVSSGNLKLLMDLSSSVEGRDVILVEDIVDSGNTLVKMKELLSGRGAKSLTTIAFLDKPSRRQVDVSADYTCFTVGNEFIVGYGLDYAQKYRDLPYVGVLKREVYEGK